MTGSCWPTCFDSHCIFSQNAFTIWTIYPPWMKKAIAPHSRTLAWKIPWTEEPCRLQSMGSRRVGQDWAISLSCIGEGNGNPLQCSCLENPKDGGGWWAAVYGIAQSQTRLKRLSSSSSSSVLHHFIIFQFTFKYFTQTKRYWNNITEIYEYLLWFKKLYITKR